MLGGVSSSTQLSQIYNQSNQNLNDSLVRIASGKRINKPSDDFAGFFRASGVKSDIAGYQTVKQDLTDLKGMADYASQVGSDVLEALDELKTLAQNYAATTDANEQTLISNDFTVKTGELTNMIADAQYNGSAVMTAATLDTKNLDPDGNSSFDVTFAAGDILTVGNLDVTSEASIDTEIAVATNYASKATGFSEDIQAHLDLTDITIASKEAVVESIEGIDEVKELAKNTDLQIRQQAAISMISQSNVSRQGLLQLYL